MSKAKRRRELARQESLRALGDKVETVKFSTRKKIGLSIDEDGCCVKAVRELSPAYWANVKAGWKFHSINGAEVTIYDVKKTFLDAMKSRTGKVEIVFVTGSAKKSPIPPPRPEKKLSHLVESGDHKRLSHLKDDRRAAFKDYWLSEKKKLDRKGGSEEKRKATTRGTKTTAKEAKTRHKRTASATGGKITRRPSKTNRKSQETQEKQEPIYQDNADDILGGGIEFSDNSEDAEKPESEPKPEPMEPLVPKKRVEDAERLPRQPRRRSQKLKKYFEGDFLRDVIPDESEAKKSKSQPTLRRVGSKTRKEMKDEDSPRKLGSQFKFGDPSSPRKSRIRDKKLRKAYSETDVATSKLPPHLENTLRPPSLDSSLTQGSADTTGSEPPSPVPLVHSRSSPSPVNARRSSPPPDQRSTRRGSPRKGHRKVFSESHLNRRMTDELWNLIPDNMEIF